MIQSAVTLFPVVVVGGLLSALVYRIALFLEDRLIP